jgi:riboflavin kinase
VKILRLKGKVFSGNGEGAKFIQLPWVKSQMAEKLGFTPYPGTLNIRIIKNHVKLEMFEKAKPIEISPVDGFCRGKCFDVYLMDNLKRAIVVPEIANYPKDIVEIVAPMNLRAKYQLKDGDVITLKVRLE